jgi:glycosyl transferase family 2/lipopolysaccharide kinase (Kdo/WaaP) family protein
MADDAVRRRGRLGRSVRALVAPGTTLAAEIATDGDGDRLLTRSDCRLVKMQRKVVVGRVPTARGVVYVKRYNVFAWRVALASLWRRSPAFAAWRGADALAARGFATPERVAAVEMRRFGVLGRSFFVTREVPDARTADVYWREAVLGEVDGVRRRAARRGLARALGDLFRRLHAAGVYHNDLKDVNVLVRGPASSPACVLLDLERIRVLPRLGRGRRVKNLVQLARTLGPHASATDRARFLRAYLGDAARDQRRWWASAVRRRAARKDRGKRPPPLAAAGIRPRVSCTIICQNEEATIGPCLESAAWCDEIVLVDGGSTDATLAIARRFTDRIFTNDWPGYRAQKQFALDHASGDWVLNLDADERVSPELATEVRAALATVAADVDGFAIPRLVSYLGRWWYRGGWYPRRIVRLVRRRATTWGGTDPHERAVVRGRVVPLREPILHYSYESIAEHLRSANTLTAVAARQERLPARIGAGRLVAEPLWRFLRSYVIKRAALNGLPGLFVASTDAFYVFLRWAKVWERRRHEGVPAPASRDLTVHGTRP